MKTVLTMEAYAPLGYIKNPDQVGHLIVDEETKWIVEKIYALAVQGTGAAKIAKILTQESIPTPSWIHFQRSGYFSWFYEGQPESKRYMWSIPHVKNILTDETYIGNSVHHREVNVSFKCKKKISMPKEEWWTVEHTHEAIIDKDTFDRIQQQISTRRRQQKDRTTQIFAGLLKCADCDYSMRVGTNTSRKKPFRYYQCSRYAQWGKGHCSSHYIRYDVLYAFVLSRLQYWIRAVHQDEHALLERLSKSSMIEQASATKRATLEKKRAEKRLTELDNLIAKIYEDRLSLKQTRKAGP